MATVKAAILRAAEWCSSLCCCHTASGFDPEPGSCLSDVCTFCDGFDGHVRQNRSPGNNWRMGLMESESWQRFNGLNSLFCVMKKHEDDEIFNLLLVRLKVV